MNKLSESLGLIPTDEPSIQGPTDGYTDSSDTTDDFTDLPENNDATDGIQDSENEASESPSQSANNEGSSEDRVLNNARKLLAVRDFLKFFKKDAQFDQTICDSESVTKGSEEEKFCTNLNNALMRIAKNTDIVNKKEATETTLTELTEDKNIVDESTEKINKDPNLKDIINMDSIEDKLKTVTEVN